MNPEEYNTWRDKLERFCAYQERCIFDVKRKMSLLKVDETNQSKLLSHLLNEGFLDEVRFVRSFMRTKTNYKKDGVNKIKYALRSKGISNELIESGFLEIDQSIYSENLATLIEKKWSQIISKNDTSKAKSKLISYLMGKGYRYDDFKTLIQNLK